MSLKCSVLGHRFDETSVERERHEEGTEVVITITEVETCSRCGESRVVSENKEVTTMETPDDGTDASPAGTAESAPADEGDVDAATDAPETAGADDAEIIDAGDGSESTAQTAARSETAIPDAEGGTTEDDDGVIIDSGAASAGEGDPTDDAVSPGTPPEAADTDAGERGSVDDGDADAGERDPGSWPEEPESDVERPAGAAEWPDDDARDAHGDAATTDIDVGGGSTEWPEDTRRDPDAESGAGPELEPVEGPTITVPEGMFKCSECGFTTEVESSSLRAGDFCPECHQGTLVQDTDTPSPD